MKVLFIISDSTASGGTEKVAYNILNKLRSIGIECYLLSRYIYDGDNPCVLNMEQHDYNIYHFLLRNPINKLFGNKLSDWYLKETIFKVAKKYHVDWIINHTYDLSPAIPVCKEWNTAQVLHWSITGYENSLSSKISQIPMPSRLFSTLALRSSIRCWHKSLHNFDKVVCLTSSAISEVIDIIGVKEEKNVITIPNPIMQSDPAVKVSTLSNRNIVYVGRLSHEKGVMRLLRIWEKVSKVLTDVTLSIYGHGYAITEMKDYISKNNLDRVVFCGFQKKLEYIYLNADLCLLTSDTEGFGMVLIESMYYGVPCISFDCPISPKEVIADAGVLCQCYDEERFATNVVRLMQNPEILKEYQKKSIIRASDFYVDKVIARWEKMIYSKVK